MSQRSVRWQFHSWWNGMRRVSDETQSNSTRTPFLHEISSRYHKTPKIPLMLRGSRKPALLIRWDPCQVHQLKPFRLAGCNGRTLRDEGVPTARILSDGDECENSVWFVNLACHDRLEIGTPRCAYPPGAPTIHRLKLSTCVTVHGELVRLWTVGAQRRRRW